MHTQSEKIDQIVPALIAAQIEIGTLKKDSTNPHFKNQYLSLDAQVERFREVLPKHGLLLVQGSEPYEARQIMAVNTVYHVSGQWIRSAAAVTLEKENPQGAIGALTYGRRGANAAMFSLLMEEDDDGNRASAKAAPRAAAPAKATAPEGGRQPYQYPPKQGDAPPPCPKCHGAMWDNRVGKKNPKAPDFKCKDRENCDGLYWKASDVPGSNNPDSVEYMPTGASGPDSDDDLPF